MFTRLWPIGSGLRWKLPDRAAPQDQALDVSVPLALATPGNAAATVRTTARRASSVMLARWR
jgi:hypothetical protein